MKNHSDKSLSEIHESVNIPVKNNWWRTLLAFIGPAYLVSVGYMDPGNWATDIAGGSAFGYKLVWVLLMSNLMALLLQTLAARLGIVKGWDLAQASRQQYPQWANVSLYIFAEIAIAACDLAEIIGMAIGLNLLFGLPLIYGVIITVLDSFLLLLLINKGVRKLEMFILSLVSIIGISFIAQLIIVKPDLMEVSHGFIPSGLSGNALYIAIGIIGATVMPHNLYLHSALVQSRKIEKNHEGILSALKYNFIDSFVALNMAFFVNAAILILAATAFYKAGFNHVSSIQDAHLLLQNLFGSLAPSLFAIALICAGQSSTITGTLAGQIIMEGYLNLRISPLVRRIVTRLIAIVPAVITILFFGNEKLGDLLVLSQVILSLQLGFAVIPLIHFTSNKQLMGDFAIKNWVKILAWACAILIVGLNIKLVIEELNKMFGLIGSEYFMVKIIIELVCVFALVLLIYITFNPLFIKYSKQKQIVPHGNALQISQIEFAEYKRIAITVDFSKHDEATIQHALTLGGKDIDYLLIHIVESAIAKRLGKDAHDLETQTDLQNLQSYSNDLQKLGFKTKIELGYGNRANEISKITTDNQIDVLVMGAHGHAGLSDLVFGSTVDAVRHLVKIPVLVVKA
jgi:manganese transport protein